jgi:NAD(P)H dehydrogenase (quinone)
MARKALIVLAHPAERSLSRLFAQTACEALSGTGHEANLLDLYSEGFDPVLSRQERAAYYAKSADTAAIADHADRLAGAETLVLVFPTWWFGMPAILKGWLDRVFAPGVAFDHASDFGPIKPRLTKLKKVVVITTLGSPAWIDWLVMRRPVRRILRTAVFGLCAPQAKFVMLSIYAAENPTPKRIESFKAGIAAALK